MCVLETHWSLLKGKLIFLLFAHIAAATTINSESLSQGFNGILGLALPVNSVISQLIRPVTNNNPDGATFSSNLFGITPLSQAPSAHFFSIVLQRPGSDRLPSLLSIGRHPSAIVPDPSKIAYSIVVSDEEGTLFWKTYISAITVYVDGMVRPVAISTGVKGTAYPVALLDSGVPLIITTSTIANGIYGALGIGPAADGQCEYFIIYVFELPFNFVHRLCTVHNAAQYVNYSRRTRRNSFASSGPYSRTTR
jgi:hypothetical protein